MLCRTRQIQSLETNLDQRHWRGGIARQVRIHPNKDKNLSNPAIKHKNTIPRIKALAVSIHLLCTLQTTQSKPPIPSLDALKPNPCHIRLPFRVGRRTNNTAKLDAHPFFLSYLPCLNKLIKGSSFLPSLGTFKIKFTHTNRPNQPSPRSSYIPTLHSRTNTQAHDKTSSNRIRYYAHLIFALSLPSRRIPHNTYYLVPSILPTQPGPARLLASCTPSAFFPPSHAIRPEPDKRQRQLLLVSLKGREKKKIDIGSATNNVVINQGKSMLYFTRD